MDSGAVARGVHALHRRPLPRVDHGVVAARLPVVAVRASKQLRELRPRDETVADGCAIDPQGEALFPQRLPLPCIRRDLQLLDAPEAFGGDDAVSETHGDFVLPAVAEVSQAFEQQRGAACQVPGGAEDVPLLPGLEHPDHLHAGQVHLLGRKEQQRPAADDRHAVAGPDKAGFHLRLHAAESHDARQGPPGKRLHPLIAPCAQDQRAVGVRAQLAAADVRDPAFRREAADHLAVERFRDPGAPTVELGEEGLRPRRGLRADRDSPGPRAVSAPVDAADGVAAVDEGGTDPVPGKLDGRAQAGRARTDDRHAFLTGHHRRHLGPHPAAIQRGGPRDSGASVSTCPPGRP